ncbi:sugar (pentulose or hexulose) kinase [Sphingobium sp. OAS761]|uniref:FGGY-family carbohydrate kinase n=1 Tax=Sphingobium sp. OAS761 TaxID=2817901 RepID=UPI00209D1BD4|nr:carbohydrate kinase [Sphingobium sp. OAS761]MCP1470293.1 sugar (pentulose or hexulose) kinase [Sphingobium sp. OAS761]
MRQGAIIVIDIGKTLSKVSLWSRDGHMVDRQTRANLPCQVDGVRCLDAVGIGDWLLDALTHYAGQPVECIVPVGHGAGVVALGQSGPVMSPIDYEQAPPQDILAAYRRERDPFAVTGSPALPDGLNMGAQIFWMDRMAPEAMRGTILLPWAQYWSWFLTGRAVSEVTSLGCHSDVWAPGDADFSPMARRLGWAERFAPVVPAAETIGTLTAEVAHRTGLPASTRVLAGLHDSNAALLAARGFAEIAGQEATVLSTGTWFVAMRLPSSPVDLSVLPEARDCLVNVDAYGHPVPSARFMGGREIESLIEIDTRRVDIKPDQPALLAAVEGVLASGTMILPTLAPGFGPYPDGQFEWINRPDDWFARRAAACLYAALVADTAIGLIGSRGRVLVEGRFAEAEVFVRALARLRPDVDVYVGHAQHDVSFGALRLIDPGLRPGGSLTRVRPLDADMTDYRAAWADRVRILA